MPPLPADNDPLDLARALGVELRRRAGEIETIFDMLPFGLGISEDPECRNIRVNRAFAEVLGIQPSQNASLSAPASERPGFRVEQDGRVLTPDELPMQYAARHAVEVRNFEVDVIRPDGRRVSLYEYAAPLFDEQGQVRGAIGVFVDITERRRVEQEQRFLAEASGVLASSLEYESTLRTLARLAVPVFGDYCTIDVHCDDGTFGRVEFVVHDPALQPLADTLRRYPPVLSLDSPSARAIRTGAPVVNNECDWQVLKRSAQDETHLAALIRFGFTSFMMVPLRARGRTLGLLTCGSTSGRQYLDRDVTLATDVASRAALAIDNALLYRHAQDANRLKEEFLATLSHELRTPLNALLGWTQILKGGALDEAAARRALESIERNARAQTVLINDLLDVSRVITGKLRLQERVVDLHAVVLGAVDAIRPAVRAREIDLHVALPTIASTVIGDPDRLQQVVWNLLSNAVKFTPTGGRIELAIAEPAGAVQITVTDTGTGIDPVFLPYVFDRFRQGDSSTTRAQSGLGLGLAIVRHLVDLHGGAVTAESDGQGRGSRFTVTLPSRPAAGSTGEGSEHRGAQADRMLHGIRVLGVDDDEDARELILHASRGAGADVMVVGSTPAALEALVTFRPDVIVADIGMPGLDGYSLAREVRSRQPPHPPIVGLSAYVGPDNERQALESGFACHLGKPTDIATLVTTIAAVVNKIKS